MHFAATAVLEAHGPEATRRAIAEGRHLTTLAFSEVGFEKPLLGPVGHAQPTNRRPVTSQLDRPQELGHFGRGSRKLRVVEPAVVGDGPMTLWLVPRPSSGLTVGRQFDGLGLRGNGSVPVDADGVVVDRAAMLGPDGEGLTSRWPWCCPGS